MNRKDELLKLFEEVENKSLIVPLIDDLIFMEEQLTEFRKLPMLKVHPKDPAIQKATTSAKLFKETLQQYNNTIRTLASFIRRDESEEVSPLEKYLEKLNNN